MKTFEVLAKDVEPGQIFRSRFPCRFNKKVIDKFTSGQVIELWFEGGHKLYLHRNEKVKVRGERDPALVAIGALRDVRAGIRQPHHWLWDSECQAHWPVVEVDGCLYGFPDSSDDGTPAGEVVFIQ